MINRDNKKLIISLQNKIDKLDNLQTVKLRQEGILLEIKNLKEKIEILEKSGSVSERTFKDILKETANTLDYKINNINNEITKLRDFNLFEVETVWKDIDRSVEYSQAQNNSQMDLLQASIKELKGKNFS